MRHDASSKVSKRKETERKKLAKSREQGE